MVDVTTPVEYDFTWVRGTNVPAVFAFARNGVAIPFDDARMSVTDMQGDLIFRLSIESGGAVKTNPSIGEVTFTPTTAQTRSLKESKPGNPGKNRYEIELRDGTNEAVYVWGVVAGILGGNDDEVVS
jgi:hypothetical protein